MNFPANTWPSGAATGVGSMPGEDIRESMRIVAGELPAFPHLPELPARGPGADLTGRSAGLLVELYTEVQPSGWRFTDRPGRDFRRAGAYLREDLDTLEEFTQDYRGPLKIQVAGPWTLAATVELSHGDKALADPGACRDLTESLAEGVRAHVAEVARRVPGADVVLQLDEPALPAALAGTVPTASGFGRLRAIGRSVARDALRTVVDAAGVPVVVHSCAPAVPVALLREAGAAGVSLDVRLLRRAEDEPLGEAIEAGFALFAGVVPAVDAGVDASGVPGGSGGGPVSARPGSVRGAGGARGGGAAKSVAPVAALWNRLGFRPESLAGTVVVTPVCGLAGASPGFARWALSAGVEAARVLRDDPQGTLSRAKS